MKGINLLKLTYKGHDRDLFQDRLRKLLRNQQLDSYGLNTIGGVNSNRLILAILCNECIRQRNDKKGGKMVCKLKFDCQTGIPLSEIGEIKWVRVCSCIATKNVQIRGLERRNLQDKGLSALEMKLHHNYNLPEGVINTGRVPTAAVMRKAKSEKDLPQLHPQDEQIPIDRMYYALLLLQYESAKTHKQHVMTNRQEVTKYRPGVKYYGMIQHIGNPANRENFFTGDIPVILANPELIALANVLGTQGGVCALDATGGDTKKNENGIAPLNYQAVAFFKDNLWEKPQSMYLGCIVTLARSSEYLVPRLRMLIDTLPAFDKWVIDDSGCIRTSLIQCLDGIYSNLPKPVDSHEQLQSRYKRMLLLMLFQGTSPTPRISYIQSDLRHFLGHLLANVPPSTQLTQIRGLLQSSIHFLQEHAQDIDMCKKVLVLMKAAMSSPRATASVRAAIALLRGVGDGMNDFYNREITQLSNCTVDHLEKECGYYYINRTDQAVSLLLSREHGDSAAKKVFAVQGNTMFIFSLFVFFFYFSLFEILLK